MSADLLPQEGPFQTPPLARQPSCPACDHEQHSPVRCETDACGCTVVPTPGIYP